MQDDRAPKNWSRAGSGRQRDCYSGARSRTGYFRALVNHHRWVWQRDLHHFASGPVPKIEGGGNPALFYVKRPLDSWEGKSPPLLFHFKYAETGRTFTNDAHGHRTAIYGKTIRSRAEQWPTRNSRSGTRRRAVFRQALLPCGGFPVPSTRN